MVENFHEYTIKSNLLENIHSLTFRPSLVVTAELKLILKHMDIARLLSSTHMHACE